MNLDHIHVFLHAFFIDAIAVPTRFLSISIIWSLIKYLESSNTPNCYLVDTSSNFSELKHHVATSFTPYYHETFNIFKAWNLGNSSSRSNKNSVFANNPFNKRWKQNIMLTSGMRVHHSEEL